MPVRSLNSSVHKWPSADKVLKETGAWAQELAEAKEEVRRIGVFGSYGRRDAGVGSDLDLVIIVSDDPRPFERRSIGDPLQLPLPADILIYTIDEWEALKDRGGRFLETLQEETRWLVDRQSNSR